MKNEKLLKEVKRYAFMLLACFFYALSLQAFLIPNGIVGGGVSGAASLINIKTGLSAGLFIAIINIPILCFGFKMMGWKFIVRCFITTISLSFATETWVVILKAFDSTSGFTDNPILAALYGGILQGLGIGLFIKYETSSGGTELLGRLTHNILPVATIATHVALFDGLVVLLGAILLHSLENILFALILIFVSARVSDILIVGFSKAKLCYIITTKGDEISEYMINHSPRGITKLEGTGMYSKSEKDVLITCVKNSQIAALKASVKSLDENAFFIVSDATEVYGKGFHQM